MPSRKAYLIVGPALEALWHVNEADLLKYHDVQF